MSEELRRPPEQLGHLEWSIYPEDLFIKAGNLVKKGNGDLIANEAFQILVGLKGQEAKVMSSEYLVLSYQANMKASSDTRFNINGLKYLKEELAPQKKELNRRLKDLEKRKRGQNFNQVYLELNEQFDEILLMLNSNWQRLDLLMRASLQSDLLKLIDFYAEQLT